MLLKKGWIFVIVAVIICVVGFIFGRSQAPQAPIKIYKAVETTQESPKHVVKDASQVQTQTESPSASRDAETGDQKSSAIEVSAFESEEIMTHAEAPHSESIVEGETTSHITKGAVPPELSRDAMERTHKEYQQEQRVLDIMAEMSEYANKSSISREDSLRVLKLQQELLQIQQDRGMLHQEGGNAFENNEFLQFATTRTTDDGRFPTSKGHLLIEGIRKNTPDSPEKQDSLERIHRIVTAAIENGDEYFYLNPDADE